MLKGLIRWALITAFLFSPVNSYARVTWTGGPGAILPPTNLRQVWKGHAMANDFSGDANCVAVWNVDDGALLTDSKGTNTLSNYNAVTQNTTTYKQGDASADFESTSNQSLYITDANLDAGFPTKSGSSNNEMTICFWARFESLASAQCAIAKWREVDGDRSWRIWCYPYWNIGIGYSTASEEDHALTALSPTTGVWYHVAASIKQSDGAYHIRVWDDNAQQVYDTTGNFTNYASWNINAWDLTIGSRSTVADFDGLLDEIVVFSKILTSAEIDQVRDGTFGTFLQDVEGNISFGGSVTRFFSAGRAASGAIGLSGDLQRQRRVYRSQGGDLTPAGQTNRFARYGRSVSGAASLSGALTSTLGLVQQAVDGALTAAGSLLRKYRARRQIDSEISSAGDQTQILRAKRTASGAVQPTGSTSRLSKYSRAISGSLGSASQLTFIARQFLASSISFAGQVVSRAIFRRSVGGSISSSGAGDRTFTRFLRTINGILTPRGAVPMGSILKKGLLRLGKAFNLR